MARHRLHAWASLHLTFCTASNQKNFKRTGNDVGNPPASLLTLYGQGWSYFLSSFSPLPPSPSGLTLPLLTTAAGEKLGKSAENAVWLSPEKTSSYEFYQHFVRTADQEVETYLKYFTLLPIEEIQEIVNEHEVGALHKKLEIYICFGKTSGCLNFLKILICCSTLYLLLPLSLSLLGINAKYNEGGGLPL